MDKDKAIEVPDMAAWRTWLAGHHLREKSVWVIFYHKNSGIPSLDFGEAVDEALCWGWVDSKISKRDEQSYYQFFSRRNPKSNWSRVNKNKVEQLMAEGRMQAPGLELIRIAKETGTWNALDEVENLVIPPDLMEAFQQNPPALDHWNEFPRSVKRAVLEWIHNAKRPETRQKRITQTAELSRQNIRPLQ